MLPHSYPRPFSRPPVFTVFADYVKAAATGSRDSGLHMFFVIIITCKTTLFSLAKFYDENPHSLTRLNLTRFHHCLARFKALFYTLHHAPKRFFAPAQLRYLARTRNFLAHLWQQPIDFSLFLEKVPSRNSGAVPSGMSARGLSPNSQLTTHNPQLTTRPAPPADPLLLQQPGRALASLIIQLGRFYNIKPSPPIPRPTVEPNPSSPTFYSSHSSHSSHFSHLPLAAAPAAPAAPAASPAPSTPSAPPDHSAFPTLHPNPG